MLKSELEKAAREYCNNFNKDYPYGELTNYDICRVFEAGAKWALEWVADNLSTTLNSEDWELFGIQDETETKEK